MKRLVLSIGAVALLSQPHGFAQAPQSGACTLAPVAYGMQLKTPDGRVVFQVHYNEAADVGSAADLTERGVFPSGADAVG